MRIAFFVNAFPMMSEAFIANSAAALMDRGYSVDIFGLGNVPATGLSVKAVEAYGLDKHTVNVGWPKSYAARAVRLPAAIARIVDHHGLAGLSHMRPDIYRRSFMDLSAFYQAGALRGDGHYDILHCQFATLAEPVIKHRKAGFLTGRLVVNFRGYDITETVEAMGPAVYDHVWPEAVRFIANCEHFRDRAIAIGCPEDRIDVVGSGIRLDNFPFEPVEQRDPEALRFLMVGRLIERKGFHIALQALAEFAKRNPQKIAVDIVGDGVMRAQLETLATGLGLAGAVTFHGARTHPEIADFIRHADVFLAPSLTSAAGGQDAPVNTLKEAMAIGRPVVGTLHGGIPELVIEGDTGTLASEGDAISLCAAIERLTQNRSGWPDMVQRGRARVEQMYALDRTTDDLVRLYEKTCSTDDGEDKLHSNIKVKAA